MTRSCLPLDQAHFARFSEERGMQSFSLAVCSLCACGCLSPRCSRRLWAYKGILIPFACMGFEMDHVGPQPRPRLSSTAFLTARSVRCVSRWTCSCSVPKHNTTLAVKRFSTIRSADSHYIHSLQQKDCRFQFAHANGACPTNRLNGLM